MAGAWNQSEDKHPAPNKPSLIKRSFQKGFQSETLQRANKDKEWEIIHSPLTHTYPAYSLSESLYWHATNPQMPLSNDLHIPITALWREQVFLPYLECCLQRYNDPLSFQFYTCWMVGSCQESNVWFEHYSVKSTQLSLALFEPMHSSRTLCDLIKTTWSPNGVWAHHSELF